MRNKSIATMSAARFLVFSICGIFLFFVQVQIGEKKSILIDHMIAWMRNGLQESYAWILTVICGCYLWRKISGRKSEKKMEGFFHIVQGIFGLIFCLSVRLDTGFQTLTGLAKTAVDATGNILCAIFLSSLFIPLLVDYGLVDAMGIFCAPFMRKVFLTPGSSAVIGASAFLGNYSVGHVVSRQMYDEHRFTEKEMIIVAMGFSTCSIGLMLNLVNYLDLMPYWNSYVVCVLFTAFATTAAVSRLYPINRKKEEYKGNVSCISEKEVQETLWKRAWRTGTDRAGKAPKLYQSVLQMMKRVAPVICEITPPTVLIVVCGTYLARNTDVFYYLGCAVWPVLKAAGISSAESYYVMSGIGASITEPVLAGVICNGLELSFQAKWIIAVVPYSAIVFFAGFIPSARSAKIPCKIWEMLVIWLERVIIGTCLAALAAKILCRIV